MKNCASDLRLHKVVDDTAHFLNVSVRRHHAIGPGVVQEIIRIYQDEEMTFDRHKCLPDLKSQPAYLDKHSDEKHFDRGQLLSSAGPRNSLFSSPF
jgi:hypothetical protein